MLSRPHPPFRTRPLRQTHPRRASSRNLLIEVADIPLPAMKPSRPALKPKLVTASRARRPVRAETRLV